MSTNETPDLWADVLSLICESRHQAEIDYFIHCFRYDKPDIVKNILLKEGFSSEVYEAFRQQVVAHLNEDLERVHALQQSLLLSDEAAIELANTILRILK